jgi:hypothetical protein
MAKALKKQRKPAEQKVATFDTLWVELGTPSEFGTKRRYDSMSLALNAIDAHFHSQDGYINRHVREKEDVMKEIAKVSGVLRTTTIRSEPITFEVMFDPYYNMRLAARIWKGVK